MANTETQQPYAPELLPIPVSEIQEWEEHIAEQMSVDCEIIKHSDRLRLRFPEDDPRGVGDIEDNQLVGLIALARGVHSQRPDMTPQDFWNRIRISDKRFKDLFADTDQDLAMNVTLQAAIETIFEAPPAAAHNTRLIQTIKCTAQTRVMPVMPRSPLPPPAYTPLTQHSAPNKRSNHQRNRIFAGAIAASIATGAGAAVVRVGSSGEGEAAFAATAPAQTYESSTTVTEPLDAPVVISGTEAVSSTSVSPVTEPASSAEAPVSTALSAQGVIDTAPTQEVPADTVPATEAPAPTEAPVPIETPPPTESPVTEAPVPAEAPAPSEDTTPTETAPPETMPPNDGTVSRVGCTELGGFSKEFPFGVKGGWEAVRITYDLTDDTQIARVLNTFGDKYKIRNITASTPANPVFECMPPVAEVREAIAGI